MSEPPLSSLVGAPPAKINTPCPACGSCTLIVGSGGYLVCSLLGCPDPTAVDQLLSDPHARDHVVTFGRDCVMRFAAAQPVAEVIE